ncbi:MAG: PQQ-dependent catabolism-associated CXXCW motif protein [Hyphomicrobium sp.]|jgi:PQQ-dependent catabolism-associated CXXCW motif protein
MMFRARPIIFLLLSLFLGASSLLLGAASADAQAGGTSAPGQSGAAPHPDVPGLDAEGNGDAPAVEPEGYRMEDFRAPVPSTLKGARVLTSDEAADIWNKSGSVFIDVYPQAPKPPNLPAGTFWRDPVHRSIEGAQWLPNVGYGALSSEMDAQYRRALDTLSKGKPDTPLVFFCLKNCWMSWNAAKRALDYGYTNVMWFRDGSDGWQELGYPLVEVKKLQ